MEKVVYKFLDLYLGHEVYSLSRGYNLRGFYINSKKNNMNIFTIIAENEGVIIYRGDKLCKKIASFFDITEDEAMTHVKLWFGNRHGLSKVGDVIKFAPYV
jgi:hypothetical protein